MASTSFIPPQHVTHTTTNHHQRAEDLLSTTEMVASEWPELHGENMATKESDWEMIAPAITTPAVVTFDPQALIVEGKPLRKNNPKVLKHAQSSPDLRSWAHNNNVSDDDEESSSAVLVEDETSMASSGVDLVSEPPSVWSVGSSNNNKTLSFKEILQKPTTKASTGSPTNNNNNKTTSKRSSFKPTFVVVKPSHPKSNMKRNSRSMGNLRALDHIQEAHDEVLGDTDAGDFYSRKAQGALGRKNGQKIRPDEAKRLQMTMAKKNLQKQQRG